MKLHYKGKYDLNPESLPYNPHKPGATPFKEAKDSKTLGLIANGLGMVLLIPLITILCLRYGFNILNSAFWGCLLSLLSLFPHEFIHALCFKEDVYIYTNLKHGMLFVVGPETMSKKRFIFLSLLPNLVFGFIPYFISLIIPTLGVLGIFGALCISMGSGDYYNVFHALTQMPKGSRTYMYQFNSFWYLPQ